MNHQEPTLGKNRTGSQMSPLMSAAMLESSRDFAWDEVFTTGVSPDKIRQDYAKDAHPIGSIPLPMTLKGLAKAGYEKIKGERPELFIDKLGERLAFERVGVRLYRSLIRKWEMDPPQDAPLDIFRLQEICDAELQHMLLLKQAMEEVGADPTSTTPSADAASVASMGLVQILNDPRTSVTQCLEAMLIAELADNDAWNLLIDLTKHMGHDTLLMRFQQALAEEDQHLAEIRSLLKDLTLGKARM